MSYIGDLGIDATEEEKTKEEYQPLPAGRYVVVVESSYIKPTKTGNGRYLELVFRVVQGNCEGRKVWQRYNIDNPNSTAVEIAKADLRKICRAVGVLRPQNSEELHDIPLAITVSVETRDGRRWNKITEYARANVGIPGTEKATKETAGAAAVDDLPF